VATRDSAATAELGQADATAELELRGSGDDQADATTEMAFSDSAEAAEAADDEGAALNSGYCQEAWTVDRAEALCWSR